MKGTKNLIRLYGQFLYDKQPSVTMTIPPLGK